MAQPSPSEFLTFYRHMATRGPSLLTRPRSITTVPRAAIFSTTTASSSSSPTLASRRCFSAAPSNLDARKDEAGKRQSQRDDESHLFDKDADYDVQSEAAQKRKRDHQAGTGGNATARHDELRSTERAKKDHPEAPDAIIGMQDERGQKGH